MANSPQGATYLWGYNLLNGLCVPVQPRPEIAPTQAGCLMAPTVHQEMLLQLFKRHLFELT